jgi:uncharacterized YccA/Bax inhibitor family protein
MALFGSSNPILDEKTFLNTGSNSYATGGSMTVSGTVNKTLVLAVILLATATLSWYSPSKLFMYGGMIGGIVCVLFSSWKKQYSAITAPLYAAFEGLFLGTVSLMYSRMLNGAVLHAFTLTVGILFAMLFIYKTGLIKVTDKLRFGIAMATGGIMLVYLLSWILSFFGVNMPFIHDSSTIGICISLFVVGIASMNLLLDFDNFENGERARAPKYMEWYAAMGLMVTLVWLYFELLRLMSKLSSRN